MSRRKAITLAAFTAWPIVFGVLFSSILLLNPGIATSTYGFRCIFCGCLLTGIETSALIGFYICHALRNEQIEQTASRFWSCLFVLAHVLPMFIYWYLYIWNPAISSNAAEVIAEGDASLNA